MVANPDISAFFDAIDRSSKLDPDQAMGRTLTYLLQGGEKSFVDLVKQLNISPSQLLDLTAKLQSAGLITMQDSGGAQTMSLTESGRTLAQNTQWSTSSV